MLIVLREETNPYFNIAAEEYFLKNFNENIFMLWRNEPSIIIGKHQNAYSEINYEFVKEQKIPVIRRISGGGTVYHDLGNINFTFIQNISENENKIDKNRFTPKIVEILNIFGLNNVEIKERNTLTINNLKISGNSEHIWKNRILHHGTILFSTNINILNEIINKDNTAYIDKGIDSVVSSVTNIEHLIKPKLNINEFINLFLDYFSELNKPNFKYIINQDDIIKISKLVDEKYSKFEWNFGHFPKYIFKGRIVLNNKEILSELIVENGIIKKIEFQNFGDNNIEKNIINNLVGLIHDEQTILNKLNKINTLDNNSDINIDSIIKLFF